MDTQKDGSKKLRIPALRLKHKILLYIVMILSTSLSLVQVANDSFPYILGIGIYVLAAVSLFASCIYIPADIKMTVKKIKQTINLLADKNKVTKRLYEDYRLRTVIFTAGGLPINIAFVTFNGIIGFMSRSPWYITMAIYYFLLGMMRFWTVRYERQMSKIEQTHTLQIKEINVYRNCSILLILMTVALGGMVTLTLHSLGGKHYPGITIYAVALYTFIKVPKAIAGRIKTGRMRSPLLVTIRNIGYADACVSILSLQTAMFFSFADDGMQGETSILMNEITGAVVCIMVLAMGIYGVCCAQNMKKQIEMEAQA